MKINKLSAACALALAGVSGQALALTPYEAQTIGLVNGKDYVYLSGASAPQNFLGLLAGQLFDAGFITYYDNGGTPGVTTDDGSLYRAYFGTLKNDASIPASLRGKTVRLLDRAKGGSVWGVIPVARAEAIATLKMDAASCVLDTGIYRCAEAGVDPGTVADPANPLSNPSFNKVSDFGVSDVAPNMFKAPYNVEFGSSQLSTAEVSKLTSFAVNTLMMGLAVTNPIPTTTYLSRAAYGSMLSGSVQNWTNIGAPAPAAGDQVVVCRRVPGSGTQSSYNWFFNNFPCTTRSEAGSGEVAPARMSDSVSGVVSGTGTAADPFVIDPSAGYTVLENSASGNVRDCLKKASSGGVHTFTDEKGKFYSVNFGTGGYGAIGVVSLDSTGKESGWSFRNMDGAGNYLGGVVSGTGVAPTKANLIEGNYDFAAELTMQYRNTTVNGVAPLPAASLAKAFVDMFIQKGGQPAFNTVAWTAALPGSNPAGANVAKATRFGNMCAPLQRI